MTALLIIGSVILLLIFAVLFLLFPSKSGAKALVYLKGKNIAHRGLHNIKNGIPENSLAAFRAAAENGFDMEIDIRLTADGNVVVFHDDNLKRMCGVDKKVSNLTLDELGSLKILNTDCKIPTLSECLSTVNGKTALLIEFKCGIKDYRELCRKADAILSEYNGRYYVQSFCPQVCGWYKKNRPDVCRGQLSSAFKGDVFSKRMLGFLMFNFISRPNFVSYNVNDAENISFKLCKALGAFPIGWTFTSKSQEEENKNNFETYIFEGFIPE